MISDSSIESCWASHGNLFWTRVHLRGSWGSELVWSNWLGELALSPNCWVLPLCPWDLLSFLTSYLRLPTSDVPSRRWPVSSILTWPGPPSKLLPDSATQTTAPQSEPIWFEYLHLFCSFARTLCISSVTFKYRLLVGPLLRCLCLFMKLEGQLGCSGGVGGVFIWPFFILQGRLPQSFVKCRRCTPGGVRFRWAAHLYSVHSGPSPPWDSLPSVPMICTLCRWRSWQGLPAGVAEWLCLSDFPVPFWVLLSNGCAIPSRHRSDRE